MYSENNYCRKTYFTILDEPIEQYGERVETSTHIIGLTEDESGLQVKKIEIERNGIPTKKYTSLMM